MINLEHEFKRFTRSHLRLARDLQPYNTSYEIWTLEVGLDWSRLPDGKPELRKHLDSIISLIEEEMWGSFNTLCQKIKP